MTEPVTPARLREFLARLGRDCRDPGSVYLVGGAGLLYQGLKVSTNDVDYATSLDARARDRFEAVLRRVGREMNLAVEEASPGQFIPLPAGVEGRHRYLGRYGSLEIYAFDPLSTALAKIARGHPADFEDIRALVEAGQVDGPGLARALAEILPRVAAGQAASITADAFDAHLREFLAGQAAPPRDAPAVPEDDGVRLSLLPAAFRGVAAALRAAHPAMSPEELDDAALRQVALAYPASSRHELRLALAAGSAALAAAIAKDAARYASETVARVLAEPAIRQARAEAGRGKGGGRER